jgi:hypothetical protein
LQGHLAWVSDPLPGSTHDTKAIHQPGLLNMPTTDFIADKGYIGTGIITPIRRKPWQEHLHETEKQYNKSVNQIRYVIEKTIAHLKTWRILHTDYRRPPHTHHQTITTTIALEFYKKDL